MPARDEAEALPELFDALAVPPGTEVFVVDNGSSDDTPGVARRWGAVVVAEPRAGYGRACTAGLRAMAARPSPPELVVVLDADDPAAAARVGRLVRPLEEGRAELVLGRRTSGRARGVMPHAAAGNAAVTGLFRGLYAAPAFDLGPFRAAPLEPLLGLGLDEPAYGWNVQMELRALRAGWRIEEVSVPFRRRSTGRSKISGSAAGSVRAAHGLLRGLWREQLRPAGPAGP